MINMGGETRDIAIVGQNFFPILTDIVRYAIIVN
jgi:hypothetical protein